MKPLLLERFFVFISFSISFANAQLLWKISGNNLSQDSYLYGTIHLVPKEKFVVKKSIDEAFNKCNKLALEIDLNMTLSDKINALVKMSAGLVSPGA